MLKFLSWSVLLTNGHDVQQSMNNVAGGYGSFCLKCRHIYMTINLFRIRKTIIYKRFLIVVMRSSACNAHLKHTQRFTACNSGTRMRLPQRMRRRRRWWCTQCTQVAGSDVCPFSKKCFFVDGFTNIAQMNAHSTHTFFCVNVCVRKQARPCAWNLRQQLRQVDRNALATTLVSLFAEYWHI